jgi:hypothetical protein
MKRWSEQELVLEHQWQEPRWQMPQQQGWHMRCSSSPFVMIVGEEELQMCLEMRRLYVPSPY